MKLANIIFYRIPMQSIFEWQHVATKKKQKVVENFTGFHHFHFLGSAPLLVQSMFQNGLCLGHGAPMAVAAPGVPKHETAAGARTTKRPNWCCTKSSESFSTWRRSPRSIFETKS
jgi:hypothetical protein